MEKGSGQQLSVAAMVPKMPHKEKGLALSQGTALLEDLKHLESLRAIGHALPKLLHSTLRPLLASRKSPDPPWCAPSRLCAALGNDPPRPSDLFLATRPRLLVRSLRAHHTPKKGRPTLCGRLLK